MSQPGLQNVQNVSGLLDIRAFVIIDMSLYNKYLKLFNNTSAYSIMATIKTALNFIVIIR